MTDPLPAPSQAEPRSGWARLSDLGALTFRDHGFFRLAWLNRWQVAEDAWRSAQPYPWQFDWFARRGVRTVINLRGGRGTAGYRLEAEACARLGLTLIDLPLRSRAAPGREDIQAVDALAKVTRPVLFHCKSGADRAGLMSALWLILHRDQPVRVAARQLSLRYGHIRAARTGILDYFFACYLKDDAHSPVSFRDWVQTRYNPDGFRERFLAARQSPGWAEFLNDRVLARE